MYISWPGQVVHIRMEGHAVAVFFEQVPWPLYLDDIDTVLDAFNAKDWAYFHERWFQAHAHLNSNSSHLTRLAQAIHEQTHYSASELMELGVALGFYEGVDREQLSNDFQRLCLMPYFHRWHRADPSSETPANEEGWEGKIWIRAIQDGNEGCWFVPASELGVGNSLDAFGNATRNC